MKTFLLALIILLVSATVGFAKDTSFHVEFTLDPEYNQYVQKYIFTYVDPKTSAIITVMTIEDATVRSFDTPTFNMPPGVAVPFTLTAMYEEGLAPSPPYLQKLIGKPTINKMTRK